MSGPITRTDPRKSRNVGAEVATITCAGERRYGPYADFADFERGRPGALDSDGLDGADGDLYTFYLLPPCSTSTRKDLTAPEMAWHWTTVW